MRTQSIFSGKFATRGQSLPEFMIAVPLFLFLILLILQIIMIFRAKTILDYATLEAARLGAVNGAQLSDIRRGLIRGLTPLHASAASGTVNLTDIPYPACAGNSAWAKACEDIRDHARITIISPTQEALNDFKEKQYDGREAIPNDNLAYRSYNIYPDSKVNVQDANILKIQVDYDYRLVVPFADLVVRGASSLFKQDSSIDTDLVDPPPPQFPTSDRFFRLPMQSHALARMQSPVYEEEVCPSSNNCDLPRMADMQ